MSTETDKEWDWKWKGCAVLSFDCLAATAFGWFLARHFGWIGALIGVPVGFVFGVWFTVWPLTWIVRAIHPLKYYDLIENPDGFVAPEDLHHFMFRRNGWQGTNDKSLFPFRCPACRRIYVLDKDAESVFLNANDLTERIDVAEKFACAGCGEILRDRWSDLDRIFNDECLVPYADMVDTPWGCMLLGPWSEDLEYMP